MEFQQPGKIRGNERAGNGHALGLATYRQGTWVPGAGYHNRFFIRVSHFMRILRLCEYFMYEYFHLVIIYTQLIFHLVVNVTQVPKKAIFFF
jgi:hypothetical protein